MIGRELGKTPDPPPARSVPVSPRHHLANGTCADPFADWAHPVETNWLPAGAILNLQRAAGNRATVMLLSPGSRSHPAPRATIQRRIEPTTPVGSVIKKGDEEFTVIGQPDPDLWCVLKVQSRKNGRYWNLTDRALEQYDLVDQSIPPPTHDGSVRPAPPMPAPTPPPAPPPRAPLPPAMTMTYGRGRPVIPLAPTPPPPKAVTYGAGNQPRTSAPPPPPPMAAKRSGGAALVLPASPGPEELPAATLAVPVLNQSSRIGPVSSNPRPKGTPAPGFGKAFQSTSIGVESELGGFVCALPANEQRTFAFVKLVETGEPLIQVTKDMDQGTYKNPINPDTTKSGDWKRHTLELVSYPGHYHDPADTANRSAAVQFLLEVFKERLTSSNHKSLETTTSPDGRFKLEISNHRHVIAAGTGIMVEENPSVSMGRSGQQATMGVKAKDFGTGANEELRMLEAAPWFNSEFVIEASRSLAHEQLDDPSGATNVYGYLKSILVFTARMVAQYQIPIGSYLPSGEPKAKGLTDPKVKNEWVILPRTKPVLMLDTLQGRAKSLVKRMLFSGAAVGDETIWKAVREYLLVDGGEVAGHGINDATIDGESAALFEFRTIPDSLLPWVPKEKDSSPVVTDPLAELGHKRVAALRVINAFVNTNKEAFAEWYRGTFDRPDVKAPWSTAAAAQKGTWIKTHHRSKWEEIVGM
jgi:Actin cross-linking domain